MSQTRPDGGALRRPRGTPLAAIGRGGAAIAFGLAVLWLTLYFFLNSTWARHRLVAELPEGSGGWAHRVSPSLLTVRLAVADLAGEGVEASGASAEVGLGLFPPSVRRARGRVAEVRVNLKASARVEPDLDAGTAPPPILDAFDLDALPAALSAELDVDALWIDAPDLWLHFTSLRLRHGQGPERALSGTAEGCAVRLGTSPLAVDLATCAVRLSFGTAPRRLSIDVSLAFGDGSRVSLGATVLKGPEGEHLEASGSVALTPESQRGLGLPVLGGALVVQGLRLAPRVLTDPAAPWDLGWEAIGLDGFGSQEAGASAIALGSGRLLIEPAGLLPRVELAVDGLAVGAVRALGLEVDDLRIGHLALTIDKRAEGALEGVRAHRIASGEVAVGQVATDLDVTIGIAGGTARGILQTPEGSASAALSVRRSPLSGRTSISARLAGPGLLRPLWALLTDELEVVAGMELDLARRSTTLEGALLALELAEDGSAITAIRDEVKVTVDGQRWLWDGLDWVRPDAAP